MKRSLQYCQCGNDLDSDLNILGRIVYIQRTPTQNNVAAKTPARYGWRNVKEVAFDIKGYSYGSMQGPEF